MADVLGSSIVTRRWLLLSIAVGLLGLACWLVGDALRLAAQRNIGLQEAYLDGIDFDLVEDFDGRRPSGAPTGVRLLYKAKFFREEIVEPESVKTLKAALPSSVTSMYFPDTNSLLWYLSFSGNTHALYAAIEQGLRSGVFAKSSGCINYSNCTVEDARTTVNRSSEDELLQLIVDEFLRPAIDDVNAGALASAKRRGLDVLQLVRLIDLDRNQSLPMYDRALVLSAFLTRPDVGEAALDGSVLQSLFYVPGGEGAIEIKSNDADVMAYVDGVTSLRNECAIVASEIFRARSWATGHDPLAELFAFLAVRSLAMPLVVQSMLILDESGKLLVNDCGEQYAWEEYLTRLDQMVLPQSLPAVTHGGLSSDIEYYQGLVPRTPEALDIIRAQIAARAEDKKTLAMQATETEDALLDGVEPEPALNETPAVDPPSVELTAPAPPPRQQPLEFHSDTEGAQRGLASLGFYYGQFDGKLSEGTRKAIRNFQVFFNYDITGELTPELFQQLRTQGAAW